MGAAYWGAMKSNKRSSIYIFTDASGPDDATVFAALYSTITEHALTVWKVNDRIKKIQINIIQTQTKICTTDGTMPAHIQELAYDTNGFFYITSDIANVSY